MAKRVYAVKEIKKLMGRTADASAPTAMGGAAILGTKAHALAGPEHTGQLPTTRLSTVETDPTLVFSPNGSGGGEFRAEAGGGGSPNLDGGLATSTYGGIAALDAGGA